jgi:formate dehydrogenase iron-sulfur subunit
MWRRSWLSREVLLFGLFFAALAAFTIATWAVDLHFISPPSRLLPTLGVIATLLGIGGTIASAFIYLVPARPAWNMLHTPIDFLLSAALLGTTLPSILDNANASYPTWPVLFTAALWLTNQVARLIRLNRSSLFERRASATLLNTTDLRAALILTIGLVLGSAVLALIGNPTLSFTASIAGVLLSRYLFFVSVVPLNMALTFTRGGDR